MSNASPATSTIRSPKLTHYDINCARLLCAKMRKFDRSSVLISLVFVRCRFTHGRNISLLQVFRFWNSFIMDCINSMDTSNNVSVLTVIKCNCLVNCSEGGVRYTTGIRIRAERFGNSTPLPYKGRKTLETMKVDDENNFSDCFARSELKFSSSLEQKSNVSKIMVKISLLQSTPLRTFKVIAWK